MGLNSFTQMVGAFFGGPLIDCYGARSAAILSYVAAGGSFLLAYYANSPFQLIASRLPNLFQQAILASRTFVSTRSNSDPRLLSYISLAYGFGSMLGPALASLIVRSITSTAKRKV
jgi:MFS family permease